MTLVERHSHRPHYPSMPYKYTPVSARLGHILPLRIRSRHSSPPPSPSPFPFPSVAPYPRPTHLRRHHFPLGMTASSVNHRPVSQKRPRAQTLVLAVPTRLTVPPTAPITPHPSSYSHSQHVAQCQQPQPQQHPIYSQPQTSGPPPGSAPGLGPIIAPGSTTHSSLSTSTSTSTSSPQLHHQHQHHHNHHQDRISEIFPRLYISDLQTAEDAPLITSLGITHVLSAMPGHVALPPTVTAHAVQVPLHDAPFAELAAHLPRTTRYIARALRSSPDARVLVHCAMGTSRSVAVVCGYLIAAHRLHPSQALEFVRARRAAAAPNRGFIDQLHEYHQSLASSSDEAAVLA